ncbi:uncharacterized protein LOC133337358 [Musca vetustissima]|uniref:uncharacterized protein LOC133337358 n=1 Tax=Musca vetustissima TaxID=27455 RepID=UPI002AB71FBF|nr:uncharacterized protein LOC133337358 [Musca vetustissima]
MTNVIVHLPPEEKYYYLQPYPEYSWHLKSLISEVGIFQPPNWRNLYNKTLYTQPEHTPPNTLIFEDAKGRIRLSGFVARMIFLFGEHFNAHLEMYQPLDAHKAVHFTEITHMVKEELLDLPMTLDAAGRGNWWDISYAVLLNKVAIMVPLSSQLDIDEVFHLLLDLRFFLILCVASWMFSILLGLIDYFFEKITWNWHLFEIFPGILGQSFNEHCTRLMGLRMIYLFIAIIGLIINTEFAAKVNSYFTSPPYHRQFENLKDLEASPVKILLQPADAVIMDQWLKHWHQVAVVAGNASDFFVNRQNFNTTYGYVVQTPLWDIYHRRQGYFRRNIFHIPAAMNLHDMMIWGIPLPTDSPYREPLNYLIHLVHERGLMDAWIAETYGHMVKLGFVPLHDPSREEELKALKVEDFQWIWILHVVGTISHYNWYNLDLDEPIEL